MSSGLSDLEDEIDRTLTVEMKEKFRKYTRLSVRLIRTGGEGDFIEGFRLCARLVGEAVQTESDAQRRRRQKRENICKQHKNACNSCR